MLVNNTILEHIIDILAPHYCVGCKSGGSILCDGCAQSVNDSELACIRCQQPTAREALCNSCSKKSSLDALFVAGRYEGLVKTALHRYKFGRAHSGSKPLSGLIAACLPLLPDGTVVTSPPTIRSHIRQRGFDHAEVLAAAVAKRRGLVYRRLIERRGSTQQVGANRRQRLDQARQAFVGIALPKEGLSGAVLLIDDVATTGATLEAAAAVLKTAGVKTVYGAAVAFEPLQR